MVDPINLSSELLGKSSGNHSIRLDLLQKVGKNNQNVANLQICPDRKRIVNIPAEHMTNVGQMM